MNAEQRKRLMILARRYGQQPSTWVGLFSVLASLGLFHVSAESVDRVAGAVAAIVGALLVVYDEDKAQ